MAKVDYATLPITSSSLSFLFYVNFCPVKGWIWHGPTYSLSLISLPQGGFLKLSPTAYAAEEVLGIFSLILGILGEKSPPSTIVESCKTKLLFIALVTRQTCQWLSEKTCIHVELFWFTPTFPTCPTVAEQFLDIKRTSPEGNFNVADFPSFVIPREVWVGRLGHALNSSLTIGP
ncbi:hypothetical protein VNO77_20108 [Canavalia gladiata]|uniref:Uncharacterized protein ycf72 n=1 Tax=Canavalia gladiata TaxID=3824 RepID=A0AAN9QJ34_CANGL